MASQLAKNKETVRVLLEACNEKPFEGSKMARYVDEDVVSTRPTGITRGKDKWISGFSFVLNEKMPNFHYDIVDMVAEGHQVWVFGKIRGSYAVGNDDEEVRESIDLFELGKDGKVKAHRDVQQNAPVKVPEL